MKELFLYRVQQSSRHKIPGNTSGQYSYQVTLLQKRPQILANRINNNNNTTHISILP